MFKNANMFTIETLIYLQLRVELFAADGPVRGLIAVVLIKFIVEDI